MQALIDDGGYYLLSNGQRSSFHRAEMMCPCGCGETRCDQELIDTLQLLREDISSFINVDRAVSCEKENKRVGGAEHSFHLPVSMAADIASNVPQTTIFSKAVLRFNGVGIYENGCVHVDMGVRKTNPTFWYKLRFGNYVYFTDADECLKKYIIKIG